MTVHNPDDGEIFYDTEHETRLRFIGRDSKNRLVMEDIDKEITGDVPALIAVETTYARENLITWTEELVKLEIEQAWARSRHDYSNRRAIILSLFEYGDDTYVVYEEVNGAGGNPKMKREIDFRRVYGRLADDYRKKARS